MIMGWTRDARIFHIHNQSMMHHIKWTNPSSLLLLPGDRRSWITSGVSTLELPKGLTTTAPISEHWQVLEHSRWLGRTDWRQRFKLAWMFERLPKVFGRLISKDLLYEASLWRLEVSVFSIVKISIQEVKKMKKQESQSQRNKLNLQKLTLMIQVCDLFDRIQANHRNVAHSGQEQCMNCSQR